MTAECSSKARIMANAANHNFPDNIDVLCRPEKLVICVDSVCLNQEFKKILTNFLEIKNIVNQHEIALALLTGNDVNFLCDFQTDVKSVCSHLWGERYKSHDTSSRSTFDLNKVFRQISQRGSSFKLDDNVTLRVIILYARVDCVPIIESDSLLNALQRDFAYFTLDILYMPQFSQTCHKSRKQQERQKSQEIFNSLIALSNSKSYVFAVEESDDPAACVLKFLAHPALRKNQKRERLEKP